MTRHIVAVTVGLAWLIGCAVVTAHARHVAEEADLRARSAQAQVRVLSVELDEAHAALAEAEQRAADAPGAGTCAALRWPASWTSGDRITVLCGDRARDAVAHAIDGQLPHDQLEAWLASRYPLVVTVLDAEWPAP